MSVIQEALRKAQREMETKPALPPVQQQGSTQRSRIGGLVQKRLRGVVFAAAIACAGIGAAVLLHDRLISAESPTKTGRLIRALPAAPEQETARVRRKDSRSITGVSAPTPQPPLRLQPHPQQQATRELPKSVPQAVAVAKPAERVGPSLPESKPHEPETEPSPGATAGPPTLEMAERLQNAGDLHGAEATLKALLKKDPERIEAIVALANLYFSAMKAPERAYPLYRRVLSLDPNRSAAHVNLGVYYLRKGDLARAKEYTERALELVPDLAEAHYNLACIEALTGNRAAAERSLKRATVIEPRCAEWAKDDPDLALLRNQGAFKRGGVP
jgi:tetratricopeptide (TPR) repeat protein